MKNPREMNAGSPNLIHQKVNVGNVSHNGSRCMEENRADMTDGERGGKNI
jgi:hypothetical protein